MARNSDVAWEKIGSEDPYYGVLTDDRYRGTPDADALSDFFASGERHVAATFATIRRTIDPAFNPSRALDFGCGVGRLTIPLAQRCEQVVGVDISQSIIVEARKNAHDRGLAGVSFVISDDDLTAVGGGLDLVQSFITFQHMPVTAGMRVLAAMLRLLAPGGVGALHFTYSGDLGLFHRIGLKALYRIPALNALANVLQRQPMSTPLMQMNDYDMGEILAALQRAGCDQAHVELTDHYGHRGAVVYFRRP